MSVGVKRKVVEVIDIDDDLDDFQPLKKPKAEPKKQFKAEKIEPKEPKIEAQQNITRAVNLESAQSTQSQLISICLVCDRPLYHLSVQVNIKVIVIFQHKPPSAMRRPNYSN
jgi:hypothetical protein